MKSNREIQNVGNRPLAIISAECARVSSEFNERRTDALASRLKDNGYAAKRVEGVYKGTSEVAFVVSARDGQSESAFSDFIQNLGRWFDQECVLFLSPRNGLGQRHAELVVTDKTAPDCGSVIASGPFYVQATKPDADAFTYDPRSGYFFLADLEFSI